MLISSCSIGRGAACGVCQLDSIISCAFPACPNAFGLEASGSQASLGKFQARQLQTSSISSRLASSSSSACSGRKWSRTRKSTTDAQFMRFHFAPKSVFIFISIGFLPSPLPNLAAWLPPDYSLSLSLSPLPCPLPSLCKINKKKKKKWNRYEIEKMLFN